MLVALALFALAAWPLLLVDVPPFQDMPNHLATAHIVAHPDLYPQLAFNGLFKSNALFTLWLYVFGGHGLFGAARVFTAIVLAVSALALPLFVLHFAGRRHLPVAMLFTWPLVHSFSVSMGFLNFAFSFALSLILLTVLDRQRQQPTVGRGVGIAVLAGVIWYAHPFPLAVVGGLVALHAARLPTGRARITAGLTLLLPLAPAVPAGSRWRRSGTWSRPRARRPSPPRRSPTSIRGRAPRTCGPMCPAPSRAGEA